MTTHDPSTIDALPDTMTNQRSGTMMMSGCGILTNGKGTRRCLYINSYVYLVLKSAISYFIVIVQLFFYCREYGDFNLDELCEGDRIGMVRKGETGSLHFYINGLDQGVAATRVPSQMWGVVDLYGMTVKVR